MAVLIALLDHTVFCSPELTSGKQIILKTCQITHTKPWLYAVDSSHHQVHYKTSQLKVTSVSHNFCGLALIEHQTVWEQDVCVLEAVLLSSVLQRGCVVSGQSVKKQN